MSGAALQAHLDQGVTTLARAWRVTRRDGVVLGFTDHDRDLTIDGAIFRADSGFTSTQVERSTGLAVDNADVLGALRHDVISDTDVDAGRFDGARVECWLVNWADTAQRVLRFAGELGEIRRKGRAFEAELRSLSEGLNRPYGRVYQAPCSAVLGDSDCGVVLDNSAFVFEVAAANIVENRVFSWPLLPGFAAGWFSHGRVDVLSGAAEGLWSPIKRDGTEPPGRVIEVWQPIIGIEPGDLVQLTAGCDKRFSTCAAKFANQLNFRGFPDIPDDDWVVAVPRSGNGS